MKNNPKVSIIIPVYNGERTLKQCLNSVLNQDYKNYEVIAVDNNSTDRTKHIIKEFKKKNKRLRYLFEPVRGIGAARNTGEKKAKGRVILMTDSDCIVPKNWSKEMIKAIKGYDAVQGFQEAVFDDFWSKYKQINSEERYEKEDMKNPIGKIDTKNFGIKKDVLKKIGYTSRKYFSGNDTYLSIKLAESKYKVRFMKNIKVKHFHANSLNKVFKRKVRWGRWTAIITKDYINFLKKTDFLKDTCQTPWTFFKFFPGIFGTLIKKGPIYTYYDFIIGIAWRIGLICYWIKRQTTSPKVKCIICGWKGKEFLPFGVKPRKAKCPRCGSLERHRLIYLYLKKNLDKKKSLKILHFSPNKSLLKFLKSYKNIVYTGVDIKPWEGIQKQDITNLSFKDNSFDIIICLHVLEHVENDKKAIKELYRVLKPNGFAIIQVPIKGEKTFEDFSITEPKQREKIFGQSDHVRICGKDYVKRLKKEGFKVKIDKLTKKFDEQKIKEMGLKTGSFYICTKNHYSLNSLFYFLFF